MSSLEFNWTEFRFDNPPGCSGVYGIKLSRANQWFYIGQSINIKKRLSSPYHPCHIAQSLSSDDAKYFYISCSTEKIILEALAIKVFQPIGNGGTNSCSFLYPDGKETQSFGGYNPCLQCLFTPSASLDEFGIYAFAQQQAVLDKLFPVTTGFGGYQ